MRLQLSKARAMLCFMNSAKYEAACEAHRTAALKFNKAQVAYRTRKIGDAEFLAARAEFMDATKAFDLAFDEEQARQANAEVES